MHRIQDKASHFPSFPMPPLQQNYKKTAAHNHPNSVAPKEDWNIPIASPYHVDRKSVP